MKKYRKFLLVAVMMTVILAIFLSGCSAFGKKDETAVQFGKFTYRGNQLLSFKQADIDAREAQAMLPVTPKSPVVSASSVDAPPILIEQTPDELVSRFLQAYQGVVITSKFWETNSEGVAQEKVYSDELNGADFKVMLQRNEISISTGIVIKNIISYPNLINSFEVANENFKNSSNFETSPFPKVFTYHRAATQFVLQTHNFVEISSSGSGGLSCSYLQENESLYDLEGKTEKFQSSLGMKMQTKIGTQYEETVFSVEIKWQLKV